ncbi:hypothetical protein [Longimicrobium sp.]|uniref:hypothetical protein n=1 Tax=Longimicrobium sp. TaxID=2029185 RepID=UPI003B3A1AC1
MFGLEILDVVIGLMFVYLLLSLLATALNEYVSAVLNLRGRELARGLGRLLDDLDEKGAVQNALDGVGKKLTTSSALLTEQLYNHRLIRPYATRRGRFGRFLLKIRGLDEKPRLPSYMPARTFALALLDILGVDDKGPKLEKLFTPPEGKTLAEVAAEAEKNALDAEATAAKANTREALQAAADARLTATRARLTQVLAVLQQQSSRDLTEHLGTLGALPQADKLASALQVQVAGLLADSQTQLQKLHDGVEIWFNNSMDRVSGAYKRTIQGWLFAIGLLIASCSNADTIDMWRRLATNDTIRDGMAARAIASVGVLDSVSRPPVQSGTATTGSAPGASGTAQNSPATGVAGTPRDSVATTGAQTTIDTVPRTSGGAGSAAPGAEKGGDANQGNASARTDSTKTDSTKPRTPLDSAQFNYRLARARLDSLELKLGWTTDDAVRARLIRADSTSTGRYERNAAGIVRRPLTWIETKLAPDKHHADLFPFDTGPSWSKLLGLLLTAIAISLGAPFWFDMLNKVISIRGAGRSPEEKAKSPQAPAKRAGEERPK